MAGGTKSKKLDARYVQIEELYQRGILSDSGYAVLNAVAGIEAGITTFEELVKEYTE